MSEGPSSDRSVENICTFLHSDEGPSLETLDFAFIPYIFPWPYTNLLQYISICISTLCLQKVYNYINYLRFEVNWEDGEDVIART